ncbi:MAG: polysaccharide deacetylase family protein [Candidatus Faecousia sp.]|nr:polysaccharide deacetylase family protein [Candidatus Faecousia sp.]
MTLKKWLLVLLAAALVLFLGCIAVNVLADPFGVFGDCLFHWPEYAMASNAATGKIAYLQAHPDTYNAYIIGASAASALDPQTLNTYTQDSYYNLCLPDGNAGNYGALADYALAQENTKSIVLCLSVSDLCADQSADTLKTAGHRLATGENALTFYGKYALCNPLYSLKKAYRWTKRTTLCQDYDCFVAQTGCYDRRRQDVARIGDGTVYAQQYGDRFLAQSLSLDRMTACVEDVRAIRQRCDEAGVRLTVLLAPIHENQLSLCEEQLAQFRTQLAAVTDYWDFSTSSLSQDARYFYDSLHMRDAVGDMALARIFGDDQVYCPDDFGVCITAQNVQTEAPVLPAGQQSSHTVTVPVLMLHHVAETAISKDTLSLEKFQHVLQVLSDAGYHTVSLSQLIDYVNRGMELPENPVCLTFDDGYLSNYELAFPLLAQYGMKAAIFMVGASAGRTTYKDTDYPIIPHFTYAQAVEMMDSGLIEVQSHTYDMHQYADYETSSTVRYSAAQLPEESEQDYVAALTEDLQTFRRNYEENTGRSVYALAYPHGDFTTLSEVLIHDSGISVTFCIETSQRNTLVKGLPQSLYALCRLDVNETLSDDALLDYLADRE